MPQVRVYAVRHKDSHPQNWIAFQPATCRLHAGAGFKRPLQLLQFNAGRLYGSGAPTCRQQTWPSQVIQRAAISFKIIHRWDRQFHDENTQNSTQRGDPTVNALRQGSFPPDQETCSTTIFFSTAGHKAVLTHCS